jgi:hypothetical protein
MREFEGSIGRTGWSLGSLLLAGVASSVLTTPAEALTIVPTFTTLVSSSARTAFNFAAGEYQNLFTDPVTVNITVNTGTTGLGGSNTALVGVLNYSGMRSTLLTDYAANPSAARTIAAGPGGSINTTTDPTGGTGSFWMSTAEGKALGLSFTPPPSDGTFTYNRTLSYTFNPANRMVAGEYDFTGVAEHEISEIMGRIPGLGTTIGGIPNSYLAYDLFRYTGANTRGITNTGAGNYFSINNGTTDLKDYNNGMTGGDPQDWATTGPTFDPTDPYNFATGTDQGHMISGVDVTAMNVIGWDTRVVPAPLIGHGLPVVLGFGIVLFVPSYWAATEIKALWVWSRRANSHSEPENRTRA